MQTFSKTDTGRARNTNQDYVFCQENAVGRFPNLFIVADGMGGHNAGDTASRIAVEKVLEQIAKSDKITPVGIWEEAVECANEGVYSMSKSDIALEGMGTTLVGVTVFGDTAYVANIGDSRLYLLSESFVQVTEDHSLVGEMVRSGQLAKDEMRTHPNKNVITRALGTTPTVHADCFEIGIKPGDVILLCSDGLCNMLDDNVIQSILENNRGNAQQAVEELICSANEAGGKDNISVILINL